MYFSPTVQRFRTALHQLHKREVAAVLQPSHVRTWARRIQERGYWLGFHWFRNGSPRLYWTYWKGEARNPMWYRRRCHKITMRLGPCLQLLPSAESSAGHYGQWDWPLFLLCSLYWWFEVVSCLLLKGCRWNFHGSSSMLYGQHDMTSVLTLLHSLQ